MKSDISNIDVKALRGIQYRVDNNSQIVDKIVRDIIEPYTKDLDRYVVFIRECLKNGEQPPTDYELEDFCMNLSTFIYFANGMCEQLGVRDDIAKAVYKETYNNVREVDSIEQIARITITYHVLRHRRHCEYYK